MIYNENEHQELFYLDIDLRDPLEFHCPSPLWYLPYYFIVRTGKEHIDKLKGVKIAAELHGLHDTTMTISVGDGVDGDCVIPSGDGKVWYIAACGEMARGDGPLTFHGVPEDFPKVDLLVCTWPRFVRSGWADDWLRCQHDPNWAPNGVPLGGIGVGKVELSRDGRFRNFSGNSNQDMPFEEPDGLAGAYLAVSDGNNEKLLATRPMSGLEPCDKLSFRPLFPQAELTAESVLDQLDVTVRLAGSLVPHDIDASSLPTVLAEWQITNHSAADRQITCSWSWPNLVGQGGGVRNAEKTIGYGDGKYCYWDAPDERAIEEIDFARAKGIHFFNEPSPDNPSADGEHILIVLDSESSKCIIMDERGVVSETVTVAANGMTTVRMVLLWAMPHWVDTNQVDQGVYWLSRFSSGHEMAEYVVDNFDEIFGKSSEFVSLMLDNDLPEDIQLRLLNCCYPLVTNSVFFKDGRFSINEGPTEMSGCYGTIDQRLGAHPATQILFPELNRTELELFTAVQSQDGGINHDLGHGNLDKERIPSGWPDITCSFVIQHARHAWTTGDKDYEERNWPKVKKALEHHGEIADEGDGVAQLGERGTSYDSYHYFGTTAYIATLWIAALDVGRKWALKAGDDELIAKIDRWRPAAIEKLEKDLWNGQFYRAYASPGKPTNENSHGGMIAGEWYDRMLAGKDVLSVERLQACADALMRLNCAEQFTVPVDEADPDGGEGALYGWLPYIESFLLAPCAILRHERTVQVWQKMIAVMQGENNLHPCDTRLMYRPKKGELSWGAYYMTAPASWLVYDALNDFVYFPEEAVLRLNSVFEGRFPVVHPRFWAMVERRADEYTLKVVRTFGEGLLEVRHIELAAAGNSAAAYSRREIEAVEIKDGMILNWKC